MVRLQANMLVTVPLDPEWAFRRRLNRVEHGEEKFAGVMKAVRGSFGSVTFAAGNNLTTWMSF